MTVLSTKAVAATVNALVTRVRRMIGDTDSDTNNQRWSTADIQDAIDGMLAQMYVKVSSGDASRFLQTTAMTYTASAQSTALPALVDANSIYKVENVDDATSPIYLAYRNPQDINRFSDENGWAIVGNELALRPVPTSAKSLLIYTLAPFIPVSTSAAPSTDQHSMAINHEELICLGAAVRLQEIDNEVPPSRIARYAQLWDAYEQTASRYLGPTYVRSTRILQN